jgi:capsular exopolysaccharide synthesis family protein
MAAEERNRQDLRESLNAIQSQMDSLRAGSDFARLNIEGGEFRDYMDQKLANLYNEFSRLEAERDRLNVLLQIAERRATQVDYDQVVQEAVEQDMIVRQLQNSLNSIDALLAQQKARFGENHRLVQETLHAREQFKKDLDARKIEIAEIVRNSQWQQIQDEVAALRQQLEAVTRQVQQARDEYKRADNDRAQYAKYEIERTEKQTLLEKANAHYESLRALFNDPYLSKLRSLGLAPEPLRVSSPRWQLYLPAGFILGLLAGLGLAFAIELLNDLIRTPSEVMRHLKVPLLGNICHADDDKDVEGIDLFHVVRQAPYSIMSECYRQLRTNLKLSAGTAMHKSLLITSPNAGDGKTSVATNLASTFLAENRRILLIDANFRRPALAHLFPRTGETGAVAEHPDYGLSNYLMGQCTDISQIIRPSGIAGLDIIDSGPLPSNPAELLDSPRMKELLEQCKTHYDYVLIDGPAMLVSDAKSLSAAADGTLVVFKASATHRGAAMRILRELQSIRANIVGMVLMGVRSLKGGYFQEIYRSYLDYHQLPVRSNP